MRSVVTRRSLWAAVWIALAVLAGCGSADGELDPAELEVRDLLGVDPPVALRWSARQRGAARRVLEAALAARVEASALPAPSGGEPTLGALVTSALVRIDVERERRGAPVLVLARIETEAPELWVQPIQVPLRLVRGGTDEPAAGAITLSGWEAEVEHLPARGQALLVELAIAAGRADDTRPLLVQPAPRAPFAAAYVAAADLLLVNPVVLAAMEPSAGEPGARGGGADGSDGTLGRDTAALGSAGAGGPGAGPADTPRAGSTEASIGNPYDFYGSLGECGRAQQLRCEACLPASSCTPVTRDASDGNAECTLLAADSGRGYFQLCLNVSLAIRTVSACVEDRAASCPQVFSAGNLLSALTANQAFLDDPTCVAALDVCLTEIYGAPEGEFPVGLDGGVDLPAPRNVDVGCTDCSTDVTCNFDPQCDPDCSSSCSGGSCGDCSAGDGTGGGGGEASGCDGCGSSDSSSEGGSSGCDGCGSSDSSSEGGSSGCDGCGSSDSSSEGGSSGCDGCGSSGSSSEGGSSCSGGDGGSGSGSSCSAAGPIRITRQMVNLVSLAWACLPLVVLLLWRRRELAQARRAPAGAPALGGDA